MSHVVSLTVLDFATPIFFFFGLPLKFLITSSLDFGLRNNKLLGGIAPF